MEEKYGRVYVQESEISANGKVVISSKILKGVRFCNTTHKWLDVNGMPSPLYASFRGRRISVQWNITQKDKNGNNIKFNAKIILPIKLGELPHQDFYGCPEIEQKKIELWETLGILSGNAEADDTYKMLRDTRLTTSVAAVCAGYKVSDMKLLYTSLDPYFILDDFIELSSSQRNMPFKTALSFWSAVSDVLEGKLVAKNINDLQKFISQVPRQYQIMILGSFALRKEIVKKEQKMEHLFQAFREFHEAIALENCSEWNHTQSTPNTLKELQRELRFVSVGANIIVEMMLVDQNIQINENIRKSFLFQRLMKNWHEHCSYVNDVMSLKKEMAEDAGATCNTVYLLHEKENLSLEDSLQKTIDKITLLTELTDETGELFVNLFAEHVEVPKFVQIIKCAMYGNIQWGAITKRYDPDMTFDCVVELESSL